MAALLSPHLDLKVYAEGRAEIGHKDSLGDAVDEARLAHSGVAGEYDLTKVIEKRHMLKNPLL